MNSETYPAGRSMRPPKLRVLSNLNRSSSSAASSARNLNVGVRVMGSLVGA